MRVRRAAAVLLVTAAPYSAAEAAPLPYAPWPTTCTMTPLIERQWSADPSRDELVTARSAISRNIETDDAYTDCLYTALAALKADFAKSGRSVDPVVDRAVADFAADLVTAKLDAVTSFNAAAERHNRYGTGGAVDPLDLSLARPPSPGTRGSLPPNARSLSMAARILGGIPDCAAFFPAWVRIHHRGGTATVSYDVDADGRPARVFVTQSSGNLDVDDAAHDCIANLRYSPAILDGVATPTTGFELTVSFGTEHQVFAH